MFSNIYSENLIVATESILTLYNVAFNLSVILVTSTYPFKNEILFILFLLPPIVPSSEISSSLISKESSSLSSSPMVSSVESSLFVELLEEVELVNNEES